MARAKKPQEKAAANKKVKPAQKTAADKSAGAAKRQTQKTKARSERVVTPAPKAKREQKHGEQQPTVIVVMASTSSEQTQSIFKKLIEVLKRIIGYKKGERDEFIYNYDEGHPSYVFKEENGEVVGFGLTHKDTTFGIKNMPLEENPDPTDKDASYIRNGVVTTKRKKLGRNKKEGWRFSDKDKPKIKSKRRYHDKENKRQTAKQKKNNKKNK